MTCFYDFLNDQFKCIDKYSGEDYDLKYDLFSFEMSVIVLKYDPLKIEVYCTCMYILLPINYKIDGILRLWQ